MRSIPGLVEGPRLFVAAHIISASAGRGDLDGLYASRWTLPVTAIADDLGSIRALVRREHTFGSDWIKTTNTGGYSSPGDDPERVTWFDDEMEALDIDRSSARHRSYGRRRGMQAGHPFWRVQTRTRYLIDAEGIEMAARDGSFIVPTMQMTQEDQHELQTSTCHVRRCGNFGATMKGSLHPSGCWPEAG